MENTQQQDNVSVWKKIKIGIAAILALVVVILIVLNWNSININLLINDVSIPLPIIIILSLGTGYLWGIISSYGKLKKRDSEIKELQRKMIDANNKKVV